jgi:hypothetical protein
VLEKAFIKVANFSADLANCQQRPGEEGSADTDSRKLGGGLCEERERLRK